MLALLEFHNEVIDGSQLLTIFQHGETSEPFAGLCHTLPTLRIIESSPMHVMLVDAMFAALNIEAIEEEHDASCVTWGDATRTILTRATSGLGCLTLTFDGTQ